MSDKRSTGQLFKDWRGGNADAGQAMAQRFADWYYAITTSRLGEDKGKSPCDRACARFSEGVAGVTDANKLVAWAQDLVREELAAGGDRVLDLDEPNAYTGNKRPKTLLVDARKTLPKEVELLVAAYGREAKPEAVEELAAPLGGNPIGILKARYAVKQHLKATLAVPFEVTPDSPILDRAPLPLYESGKMADGNEEKAFEQWMLSDIDLCRDIAEFAHFAIALRGGLPSDEEAAKQAAADEAEAPSGGGMAMGIAAVTGLAVAGIIVLVLVVAAVGYVLLK